MSISKRRGGRGPDQPFVWVASALRNVRLVDQGHHVKAEPTALERMTGEEIDAYLVRG
jgi:hypothetical protein